MNEAYFTKEEALDLEGRQARTGIGFAGIPPGTLGRVTGKYVARSTMNGHPIGYGVLLTWDRPDGLRDGFSKNDWQIGSMEVIA